MTQTQADTENIQRLLKLEIDRAADRLIKVHGKQAFDLAAHKVNVARRKGDEATHVYWIRIAEEVKRNLSVGPH